MKPTTLRRRESIVERGPLSLHRRVWESGASSRVIAIVHGFGEHGGRYDELAAWFVERGFAVHALDLRGHGHSPGPRGHVDRWDDFLDDVEAWLEVVRGEHPGRPVYLLGHSMGGLVAASLACERKPELDALVLSGPALAVSGGLKVSLAGLLRRVAPRLSMDAGLDHQGLSRDPAVIEAYERDPLVHGRMSSSLAAEFFAAAARTGPAGGAVRVPTLVLHGEDDPLCPVAGGLRFHEDTATPGSAIRVYPGLRHEIFNEPEREEIYQHLLDWLDGLAVPAAKRSARS